MKPQYKLVLALLLLSLFANPSAAWWNASWTARADNAIPNGVRPYQLSLIVSNGSGTNNATNVFCNGLCKPNFTDIRFTLQETTPLSYWIENVTAGQTQVTVWVNVTANGTVNMYYGNPTATTSTANGNATFILFDDFPGTTLNTTKWDTPPEGIYLGSTTVSNGVLTAHDRIWIGSKLRYAPTSGGIGYFMRTRAKKNDSGTTGFAGIGFESQITYGDEFFQSNPWVYYSPSLYWSALVGKDEGVYASQKYTAVLDSNYHTAEVRRGGTNETLIFDSQTLYAPYPSTAARYLAIDAYSFALDVDYIFMGNYRLTGAPAWATWGTQVTTKVNYIPPTPLFLTTNGEINYYGASTIKIEDNADYSVPTTNNLTISMWINPSTLNFTDTTPTGPGGGYVYLLSKICISGGIDCTSDMAEWGFRMYDNTGNRPNWIMLYVLNSTGATGMASYFQDTITPGEWIHIVGIINGSYTKIYKNGVLRDSDSYNCGTGTCPIVPVNTNASIYMGGNPTGSTTQPNFFEGGINNVTIYNRELSDAEIGNLYNGSDITSGRVYNFVANRTHNTNHTVTWGAGSGNTTNLYRWCINSVCNDDTTTSVNDSLSPHAWDNLTVNAINNSNYTLSTSALTINYQQPNNAPGMTLGNKTDYVGRFMLITLNATDADGDTLNYITNASYSGGTMYNSFGIFSLIPVSGDVGTRGVSFNVSDGYGGNTYQNITIRVLAARNLSFQVYNTGYQTVLVNTTQTFSSLGGLYGFTYGTIWNPTSQAWEKYKYGWSSRQNQNVSRDVAISIKVSSNSTKTVTISDAFRFYLFIGQNLIGIPENLTLSQLNSSVNFGVGCANVDEITYIIPTNMTEKTYTCLAGPAQANASVQVQAGLGVWMNAVQAVNIRNAMG